MAAVRTQLRRWKPAADEDEVSVAPSRFVLDLPEDLMMRRILNRFGKLGSRHASQIQCFACYRALLCDDRSGKLMSEVGPAVSDLLVLARQRTAGFGAVRATILTAGKPPLGPLDLAFGLPEESRVLGGLGVRVGRKTLKAHIYPDRRFRLDCRLGQIGKIELSDQRDIPLARRLALERRAFQR